MGYPLNVEFRVEYGIDFDEFHDAYAHVQRRALLQRRLIWTGIALAAVALCVYDLQHGRRLVFSLAILAYAIYVLLSVGGAFRRRLKRFYDRTPSISEHMAAHFDDRGARWVNPVTESSTLWPAFTNWHETARSFLLFRGPDAPSIVPKRAFADESQVTAFRAVLAERVGRRSEAMSHAFPVRTK